MPKSYWTRIQTPNGLKYFRADEVTDELMAKIKDEANDVFYAEYGVTSFDDIKAAYDAGKKVCAVRTAGVNTYVYELAVYIDNQAFPNLRSFIFTCLDRGTQMTIFRYPSNWNSLPDKSFADNNDFLALIQSIAPSYNNIPCPIAKDTYAMNGSILYKANTTITSEGTYASWDPEQWDAVTVGGELGKGVAYVDILQTPFADVLALYNQGKHIVGRNGYEFYRMTGYSEAGDGITGFSFQNINGPVIFTWRVTSDGPSETNNWVTPPSIYFNASIYSIAIPYDETRTYSVGDVVSKDYNIYRCNTDISVAEPWTPTHWTQTTVAAELKRAESYSKLVVFEVTFPSGVKTYPNGGEILDAINAGKFVVIDEPNKGVWEHTLWLLQRASQGSYDHIYFECKDRILVAERNNTAETPVWTWFEKDIGFAKTEAIAPEYDSTATYAVGDHCMHLGKYYECNTAISTAEAWDAAHWTETSVEDVIGNVETLLAAL